MSKNDGNDRIFLCSYLLQKDGRIRLPKAIENNMSVVLGQTYFDIYFDAKSRELVLKKSEKNVMGNENEGQHN